MKLIPSICCILVCVFVAAAAVLVQAEQQLNHHNTNQSVQSSDDPLPYSLPFASSAKLTYSDLTPPVELRRAWRLDIINTAATITTLDINLSSSTAITDSPGDHQCDLSIANSNSQPLSFSAEQTIVMTTTVTSPLRFATKSPVNIPPRSSITLKCPTLDMIHRFPSTHTLLGVITATFSEAPAGFVFDPVSFKLPPIDKDDALSVVSPYIIHLHKRYDSDDKLIPNTRSVSATGVAGRNIDTMMAFHTLTSPRFNKVDPNRSYDCRNGEDGVTDSLKLGRIITDFTPTPLPVGAEFNFRCDNFYYDFNGLDAGWKSDWWFGYEANKPTEPVSDVTVYAEDIITEPMFKDLSVDLMQLDRTPNRREFVLMGMKAVQTIETKQLRIGFVDNHPLFFLSNSIMPSTQCSVGDQDIPTVLIPDGSGFILDLSQHPIAQGKDLMIACIDFFHIDFTSVLGTPIRLQVTDLSAPTLSQHILLPLINDAKKAWFEFLDIRLVTFQPFRAVDYNKRNFVIAAGNASTYIKAPITFTLSAPIIRTVESEAEPIVCTNHFTGDVIPVTINTETRSSFTLDFTSFPIKTKSSFEIVCTTDRFYFDFEKSVGKVVEAKLDVVGMLPDFKTVVEMVPVDDEHPTAEWNFRATIPVVSQYQPTITLHLGSIPIPTLPSSLSQSTAHTDGPIKYKLTFRLNGVTPNERPSTKAEHKTLHTMRLTSYPKDSNTPTVTIINLDKLNLYSLLEFDLEYPRDHRELDLQFDIATKGTDSRVTVTDLVLVTVDTAPVWTYSPEKGTQLAWDMSPTLAAKIGMTFSKAAVGDLKDKSGKKQGPSFDLQFTSATEPLNNAILTLSTNFSVVGVETEPVFFIDKSVSSRQVCQINDLKDKVDVSLDVNQQVAYFDLSLIQSLPTTFTLSCPHLAVVAKLFNTKGEQIETKVAFMLESAMFQSNQRIGGVDSWISIVPKIPSSSSLGIGAIIVILLIAGGVAGGAFFVWKRFFVKNKGGEEEMLLN